EVSGRGVCEVEPADARRGQHREVLGEAHSGRGGIEQREQRGLLAVVGAGRVAERRSDAAIAFLPQFLLRKTLVAPVSPFPAYARMQHLRERLREPIRECLGDDRIVVVVLRLEFVYERVDAEARRDGE